MTEYCCFRKIEGTPLHCRRRMVRGEKKTRIEQESVRNQLKEYVGDYADLLDKNDYYCQKCFSKVRKVGTTAYPPPKFPPPKRPAQVDPNDDEGSMTTRSKIRTRTEDEIVVEHIVAELDADDDIVGNEDDMCAEDLLDFDPVLADPISGNLANDLNFPRSSQWDSQGTTITMSSMNSVTPEDNTILNLPRSLQWDSQGTTITMSSMNSVTLEDNTIHNLPRSSQWESQGTTITMSSMNSVTLEDNLATIKIPSVTRTQSRCFVCLRKEGGRSRLPESALLQVLHDLTIFVPPTNRACPVHLVHGLFTDEALEMITNNPTNKDHFIMHGDQITSWVKSIISRTGKQHAIMNFARNSSFDSSDYYLLLGLTKEQFFFIFEICKPHLHSSKNRSKENALAVFFMKMRLGVSQKVLAFLFGFESQARVSTTLKHVTEVIDKYYASTRVGFGHLTRQEALGHNSAFFHSILQTPPEALHLTIDCTYLFIQKPSNFELQRSTYSLHKKTNLVKPVMIILDDGYILDANNLWYTDSKNNDAMILKRMLEDSSIQSITSILEPGDAFLVDRGYRDCIDDLNNKGYVTFMPALLTKGKTQFNTKEANQSRQVTMLRCRVEMTNGAVKQHFRFLDQKIQNSYLAQLPAFFRICCAVHNDYGERIRESPNNAEHIISKLHENMNAANALQEYVEEKNLERKRVCWRMADETELEEFPTLTKDDVEMIMLGTFQVKMSERYTHQMINGSTSYDLFVHKEEDDLFRAKLDSRFNKRVSHQIWIKIDASKTGPESIISHYCSCKTGARSVGSCSHTASVLMHFGVHRGQIPPRKRNRAALSLLDAALTISDDDDDDDSQEEA